MFFNGQIAKNKKKFQLKLTLSPLIIQMDTHTVSIDQ